MKIFRILVLLICASLSVIAGPLSGVYQVGSTRTIKTIQTYIDSIKTNGISGSVTIQLDAETYNEQIFFNGIQNPDSIYIKGAAGGGSLVEFSNTSTENYVVKLKDAENIFFEKIHFKSTGSFYSTVFSLDTGVNKVEIKECKIEAPEVSVSGSHIKTLIYGIGDNSNDLTIEKCHLIGGGYGIALHPNFIVTPFNNVKIIGNIMENQSNSGMSVYYLKNFEVIGNVIKSNPINTPEYGMLVNYCGVGKIEGNHLDCVGDGGLMVSNHNQGGQKDTLIIINNRVSCPTGFAFKLYNSFHLNIFHNTFYNHASDKNCVILDGGSNFNFKNNIIFNDGGGVSIQYLNYNNLASSSDLNHIYTTSSAAFANYGGNDIGSGSLAGFSVEANSKINEAPNLLDSLSLRLDPCNNTHFLGTNLGVGFDFRGQPRNAITPAVGADEGGWLQEEDGISFNGYATDGSSDTLKQGKVVMYKFVSNNQLFKAMDTVIIKNDGSFVFDSLEYAVKWYGFIISEDNNYVNSYQDGAVDWESNVAIVPQQCSSNSQDFKPRKLVSIPTGTNTITGTIYLESTAKTTNPIPGLDVVLDKIPPASGQTIAVTQTNASGVYTFNNLPDSTYKIYVDYSGIGLTEVHTVDFTGAGGTTATNLDYCVDTADVVDACGDITYLKNVNSTEFNMFPNPAEKIVLISQLPIGSKTVVITDINGKIVFTKRTEELSLEFSVAKFQAGLYFVTVNSNAINQLSKLVVK